MDKPSRLSTFTPTPIPRLLYIVRSLSAAICKGLRLEIYNIYLQKGVCAHCSIRVPVRLH